MPPKPPAPPTRPSSRSTGGAKGGARPRKGAADAPPTDAQGPERIAKVLARAGIASRRDAEAIVLEGRVAVNGVTLDTPAVTVTPADRITVDGQPLPQPDRARLWLYHKPAGLVTTARDEQGRDTVFDALPDDLPRVMPVGRLDITSEGLLLLTNDGGLKRKLELPSTGWLRKYRVRVHGTPTEAQLAPLKAGIVIDGERFQPMIVGLDRQQGANAWLTVGLREGKNREIRRAMEAVGLAVNRLIRVSYGPFQLGDLAPGTVEEIKPRILRDQLGLPPDAQDDGAPARRAVRTRAPSPSAAQTPSSATRPAADAAKTGQAGTARPRSGPKTGRGTLLEPGAPPRKSWGMKSHGGAPPRAGDDPRATGTGAASGPGPRSWGRKSHGAGTGGAPDRLDGRGAPGGQPAAQSGPERSKQRPSPKAKDGAVPSRPGPLPRATPPGAGTGRKSGGAGSGNPGGAGGRPARPKR